MEIKEGWVVLIAVVVFIVGMIIGANIGYDNVHGDCTKLGKFSYGQRVFTCSEVK